MLQSFKDHSLMREEFGDSYPVVTLTEGAPPEYVSTLEKDKQQRSEINRDLSEITDVTYSWPLAGYEAIRNVLSEHLLNLPDNYSEIQNDETGELVYCIEGANDLYLYVFHEPTEEGSTEFYAELVNESELHEVLDEIDVGENDDSDEEAESETTEFGYDQHNNSNEDE